MSTDDYTKGSKDDLLKNLEHQQPGTIFHEKIKSAIAIRCVEDVEKSINELRKSMEQIAISNNKLGGKVYYLNLILTIATIAGVIIAYFEYIN